MAVFVVIVNCILYLAMGSFVTIRRNKPWSLPVTMVVGFFTYYALFFFVCLPIMLTYRPLSLLTYVWVGVVIVALAVAVLLYGKNWLSKGKTILTIMAKDKIIWIVIAIVTIIQVILVATTYHFTLDAAYYVANVSTSVETNMINVYDPFTGAWQDHFELRYAFATYSVYDAIVCKITGLPALVVTKAVMSAMVMLLVNILYVYIARFMCKNNIRQTVIMYLAMVFVNFTFITLYTSSNFLMFRTYEGKSIVGNITIIMIFTLYMIAVRKGTDLTYFITFFMVCLGTATVSSTANMVIPAEVGILFLPYIIKHKKLSMIPKLAICILPEVVMMLMYVLYVKGYYAIYTYPR